MRVHQFVPFFFFFCQIGKNSIFRTSQHFRNRFVCARRWGIAALNGRTLLTRTFSSFFLFPKTPTFDLHIAFRFLPETEAAPKPQQVLGSALQTLDVLCPPSRRGHEQPCGHPRCPRHGDAVGRAVSQGSRAPSTQPRKRTRHFLSTALLSTPTR